MSSDALDASAAAEGAALLMGKHEKTHPGAWFRRTWVVTVAFATAVVATLVVSTARTRAGRPDVDSPAQAHLRVVKTVAEYGDYADIHTLRWTPQEGFFYDPYDHAPDLAQKVVTATELLQKTIQTYYPNRLATNQRPFEIVFIVTDFPQTFCLDEARHGVDGGCNVKEWAPIFTFSSAPRDKSALPTLVGSTLISFAEQVEAAMGSPTSNPGPRTWAHIDTFSLEEDVNPGSASEYEFDNLIPKIIWRGSDYPFLGPAFGAEHHRESTCHSILGRNWISDHCQLQELLKYEDTEEAFRALLGSSAITPRTRAVLMSRLDDSWIDARFANSYFLTHPYAVVATERAQLGRRFNLDAQQPMSAAELAKYKYQIDLGGWGGTTWTGTIHKMTMPGCLFHHETTMKDSYFEDLVAYEHYIPVKEDLSDLRERFGEVEADPELCKRVSANAKAWVDRFLTRRGLLFHNYQKLAVPLGKVVDPYGKFLKPFNAVHAELFVPRNSRAVDEHHHRRSRVGEQNDDAPIEDATPSFEAFDAVKRYRGVKQDTEEDEYSVEN
mmetsp:Transcript_6900/g.15330  ORF Transcript_6900/g.15330 Transcript_6900/m.15330 type:complete len:553 (-) Transcript_6900:115-1773(-)